MDQLESVTVPKNSSVPSAPAHLEIIEAEGKLNERSFPF